MLQNELNVVESHPGRFLTLKCGKCFVFHAPLWDNLVVSCNSADKLRHQNTASVAYSVERVLLKTSDFVWRSLCVLLPLASGKVLRKHLKTACYVFCFAGTNGQTFWAYASWQTETETGLPYFSLGISADKGISVVQVRHHRPDAYSVEQVLLNKRQIYGGAPKLHWYPDKPRMVQICRCRRFSAELVLLLMFLV